MEITGKIIAALPIREGEGKNGHWRMASYVIETIEQYPRKMCFDVSGQKIEEMALQLGEVLTVSFNIDAHEVQGKWFNNIRAWKATRSNAQQPAYAQQQYQPQGYPMQQGYVQSGYQQPYQQPPFPPQQGYIQPPFPQR